MGSNKLKQIFYSIIFILLSNPLVAQGDEVAYPRAIAKIAPLSLIDVFGNTSCLLSLEVRPSRQFSCAIEGGFFYHSLGYGLKNNRGWRSGIEVRRYVQSVSGQYIAINATYKKQAYEFAETIILTPDLAYERSNAYTKQVSTINALYGVQKLSKNRRFGMDAYLGFGLRYKKTNSNGLTPVEANHRDYGDSLVLEKMNQTGEHYLINTTIGLRLGWILK